MKLVTTAPAFTLDPTLPWLRTDPATQQRDAYIGRATVTLGSTPYEPMALYFPAGTTLGLLRVTAPEQLVVGAAYWYESEYAGCGTRYAFGRFTGFSPTYNPRSQARRHKAGQVHFELEVDQLPANPRADYLLRDDGTETCYVDFNTRVCRLYQVTHYVNLSEAALATLPAAVRQQAGLTAEQRRWLDEERRIIGDDGSVENAAGEYAARVLRGIPEADCRGVLTGQQYRDFSRVLLSLPTLTRSQAERRRPGGAVALTWRSCRAGGQPVFDTVYLRTEDATLLVDYLRNLTDWWRAEARTQASKAAIADAAAYLRADSVVHTLPVDSRPATDNLALAA